MPTIRETIRRPLTLFLSMVTNATKFRAVPTRLNASAKRDTGRLRSSLTLRCFGMSGLDASSRIDSRQATQSCAGAPGTQSNLSV